MPSIKKAALFSFLTHQSLSAGAYDASETEDTASCANWFKDVVSNIVSFEDMMGSPDMESMKGLAGSPDFLKILESIPDAGETLDKIPDTVVNEKIQNHIELAHFPEARTELQEYFKICLSRAGPEEKVQLEADKEKILKQIAHLIEEMQMNSNSNMVEIEIPDNEMAPDKNHLREMNFNPDLEDEMYQGVGMDFDQAIEIIDTISDEDLRRQINNHMKNGNFEEANNFVQKFYTDTLVDIDDENKKFELSSYKKRLHIAIDVIFMNQDIFNEEL